MCEHCWPDIYPQLITINALPLTNYIMWQTFVHHCISNEYDIVHIGLEYRNSQNKSVAEHFDTVFVSNGPDDAVGIHNMSF